MSLRLISADDHVDLSHDNIKAFLDPSFHSFYDDAVGSFGGSMRNMLTNTSNSRWREQRGLAEDDGSAHAMAKNSAAGRAGHTDAAARLADMDTDGVQASSTYCEVSAFRYLYALKEGWREATRAFNTALAEWSSAAPDRLIVSYQIPIHDIDAAVREIQWAAATGCRSLQLPVFPGELGLPPYWDSRYDPLWRAISDSNLPVCCHIGLNTQLEGVARNDPTPQLGVMVPMTALSVAEPLGHWILGGVFERFPDLKLVLVEPGVGWVSWWLYIIDDMASRQGYSFPAITKAPSDYFRRNVFLTFIDEPDVLRHAHDRIGVTNVMWSSDYPHPVTSWPRSQAIAQQLFADASQDERDLVLFGNAQRVWNL